MEEKFVEEQKEVDDSRASKKLIIITSSLTGGLCFLSIIAYLLIGFLMHIWHPSWVIFFAPIIISSLVVAIGEKNAKAFCFPVLVVAVYVLFSSLYGLWHPLWVLFLTIPAYYALFSFKNIPKD